MWPDPDHDPLLAPKIFKDPSPVDPELLLLGFALNLKPLNGDERECREIGGVKNDFFMMELLRNSIFGFFLCTFSMLFVQCGGGGSSDSVRFNKKSSTFTDSVLHKVNKEGLTLTEFSIRQKRDTLEFRAAVNFETPYREWAQLLNTFLVLQMERHVELKRLPNCGEFEVCYKDTSCLIQTYRQDELTDMLDYPGNDTLVWKFMDHTIRNISPGNFTAYDLTLERKRLEGKSQYPEGFRELILRDLPRNDSSQAFQQAKSALMTLIDERRSLGDREKVEDLQFFLEELEKRRKKKKGTGGKKARLTSGIQSRYANRSP